MHMLTPLGLQPYDREQTRNVAVVLSKALDYRNVLLLCTEDITEPLIAKQSLHLLEMLMLMLE